MIDNTKFIEVTKGYWYEVSTGLPWSNKVNKAINGKGSVTIYGDELHPIAHRGDGYYSIFKAGKKQLWHREVYSYFKGTIGKLQVDHKDNNPSNCLIDNLQLLTHRNNSIKQKLHKNNTSGYAGVFFNTRESKYQAHIQVNNKRKFLGYFNNPEDASEAYIQAKRKYHGEESITPLLLKEKTK